MFVKILIIILLLEKKSNIALNLIFEKQFSL